MQMDPRQAELAAASGRSFFAVGLIENRAKEVGHNFALLFCFCRAAVVMIWFSFARCIEKKSSCFQRKIVFPWTCGHCFWRSGFSAGVFSLAERHDAATYIISCMQVGLAAFDLRTARLHLSQYIETSRSYQNTVTLLEYFDPSDIVIPSNSVLARSGMTGVDSIVANFTTATKVRIMLYMPFV
jgi:hypothetical protein